MSVSYVYYEYLNRDFYTFSGDPENRQLVGLDLSGSIFGAGLWSELAYNFKTENGGGMDYGRYLVGMDYTLNNGLYFMTEYYYNEKGKEDYSDYNMNDWMWSFGQYPGLSDRQGYYMLCPIRNPDVFYLCCFP